jgi:Tol biopolymer transport system component/DNA-binding CsgD family transcriptional regulator
MRRGRPPYPDLLTPREQEVLELLREGFTNQQIAERLGIGVYGARYHVSEILSKLGVSSREEAARWRGEGRTGWAGLFGWLHWKTVSIGGAAVVLMGIALVVSAVLFRSPDGPGKVAYIQNGNLWVKALPDGTPKQLTFNGASYSPKFSPSGGWILYQQGPPLPPDEIGAHVVRTDGSIDRPLDSGSQVAWSTADDVLAMSLEDSSLVVENADGFGRRQLLPPLPNRTANPLDRRMNLAWSPDGQWIVFEEQHADHTRAAAYAYAGIRAVRIDGSDEHELFSASVSPDGLVDGPMPVTWALSGGGAPAGLALSERSFQPIEAGGLPTRLLATLSSQPDSGTEKAIMLSYRDFVATAPDARRVAFVSGIALQAIGTDEERSAPRLVDTQTNKRIAVMDLQTGDVTTLTDESLVAVLPAWSPDGETIAFVTRADPGPVTPADNDAEDGRRIWTMAGDGSNAHALPIEDADCRQELPQWSGDGKQLLFVCLNSDRASLMMVAAKGGPAVTLIDELSIPVLGGSGQQSAYPEYQGHINWTPYFDWWQP